MNNETTNLKLIEKHDEIGNIKTFSFDTEDLTWTPGQYLTFVLSSAGTDKKDNQRYFTIASAPSEQMINISTRITESMFKKTLDALNPGDSIQASALGGDFVWDDQTVGPIVLVAAGIGVTPYRSILLERKAKGQSLDATLIYFNRNDEISFLDIFEKIQAEHPEFKLVKLVGERITKDRILELSPENIKEGTIYISGPEPMVETVGEELKKGGINVKQDWFPGYTDENF
jgi:ferredoxin-NADP reductase